MRRFVEGELISPQRADETLGRITTTADLAQVATGSDFITEAIVERSGDKCISSMPREPRPPNHRVDKSRYRLPLRWRVEVPLESRRVGAMCDMLSVSR
jgi:hypothetical protein